MTTPGSHNDSFASSYHRLFFGRYAQGKTPSESKIEGDENLTDAMDALALPTVGIIAAVTAEGPTQAVRDLARALYNSVRSSDIMHEFIDAYADLLASVISGQKKI
jgi:ADP-ribosyl-[dinitrogen reductase] hydrolase